MLARGGALISYGTASTRDDAGNPRIPVLKLFARLLAWNALPNGRRAKFFNLWAGARKRDRYRADLRRGRRGRLGRLGKPSASTPTMRWLYSDPVSGAGWQSSETAVRRSLALTSARISPVAAAA